jgi:VWFA-related protein
MICAKWMAPPVAMLMAVAVSAAPQPIFTSRVEGVRIDALVSESGTPIAGLGPGDFEVRDNDVPQTIDLVSLADVAVNVVLTLDQSASVAGAKLTALLRASRSLLDGLAATDSAAIITFNHAVVQRVALTRRIDDVRTALEESEAGGATALVDASLGAMLLGDTDAGRTLVVVFSDGVDTASFVRPELVLDMARRVNGVVYGVSSSAEPTRFLRDLASATGGRIVEIGPSGDPGPAFLEILREFRRRYVITFTPTGVTPGGWHKLEVRVNRPRARVQARAGYFSSAQ